MFNGYSPETFDFLWGIRFNNNKTWFSEHKQEYLDFLYNPTKELMSEICAPFRSEPGTLCKTSRIYRDARRPDYAAAPYKTSLWISIRREDEDWAREPTLFFDIRPEGVRFGLVLARMNAATLNAYRNRLDQDPGPLLKLLKEVRKTTGLELTGEEYVRKKECAYREAVPYYNLRNCFIWKEYSPTEEIFRPELAAEVRETLSALCPLRDYLRSLLV